jgi:hypothetical protein
MLYVEGAFHGLVDPIAHMGSNSVIKFLADLFGEQGTLSDLLLSDSDRRLIIEMISRELCDRSSADQVRYEREREVRRSLSHIV